MKGMKRLGLALASMVVLGITASSALAALPDLHIALGEAFPISANAENKTVATNLNTAAGAQLEGEGVKVSLTWTALSSLGTYVSTFTNVHKGLKKCKSGTEPAGTVVVSGEVHLVFVQLTPALVVGALFLVPAFTISCEGLNVKIAEGKVISTYNGALNADATEFKGRLLSEKGKPELSKYEDEAGKEVEAVLLADVGAGFVKAGEDVLAELTFKANKMFEILG